MTFNKTDLSSDNSVRSVRLKDSQDVHGPQRPRVVDESPSVSLGLLGSYSVSKNVGVKGSIKRSRTNPGLNVSGPSTGCSYDCPK